MNKIKSVLFVAGISLALTFTFGCSSGDGGSNDNNSAGGSNLSDLPKQVYLDGTEFKGTSNITLRIPRYKFISCDKEFNHRFSYTTTRMV